jgi:hypothetical protein
MALQEYPYYAAQEQSRNEQLSISTTSQKIAAATFAGQPRQEIVLRNTSPNAADIITIKLGNQAAVANEGIVLRQYDAFVQTESQGFHCWQGNIQAICATINGKLSIMER